MAASATCSGAATRHGRGRTVSDTWPQPHEGITGTDRSDDLLSLEDEAVPRRLAFNGLADLLYRACLVGHPAPVVARMWERIKQPQPGDLVIERSSRYRRDVDTQIKRLGVLLEHRTEWWQSDEEWAADVEQQRVHHEEFLRSDYAQPGDADEPFKPDERMTDHVWYVQYGPKAGDICRWGNCEFYLVPTDHAVFEQSMGTRDGSGVTITRDDLLGG